MPINYTYNYRDDLYTPKGGGCLDTNCNQIEADTPAPPQYHADYIPSTNCINLVKRYTGCVLTSYRWQVSFNIPANRETSFRIGYERFTIPYWDPMTTVAPFLPSQPGDPPVDGINAPQGLTITQAIADRWLHNDLCQIAKNLNNTFIYPLSQNQIDGLCSFLYSGGALNNNMITAINNVQRFTYDCTYSSGPILHRPQYMHQWSPNFQVVGDEILKYVYFRGSKIQSKVDRRYEEWNLVTGQALPYSIPGSSPVGPNVVQCPAWGTCVPLGLPAGYLDNFGMTSNAGITSGYANWRGSLFP